MYTGIGNGVALTVLDTDLTEPFAICFNIGGYRLVEEYLLILKLV